jgi:hypothetical protein
MSEENQDVIEFVVCESVLRDELEKVIGADPMFLQYADWFIQGLSRRLLEDRPPQDG